jgi:DNA-3-methyladenine glycosylase
MSARKAGADVLKPGRRKPRPRLLKRAELPIDTAAFARFLIGKIVVRELPEGIVSGRIVESEAYIVGDAAGHGYRGMTPRNRSLFLERGHAYIYVAYGISNMLNISSETPGIGTGVLIRALEPLEGIPIMQHNRGVERLYDLTRGPGRLAAALRIDRSLDGIDLCRKGPLWLARDDHKAGEIGESIRIGITKDADRPLRFYLRDSKFVSGPKSLNRAARKHPAKVAGPTRASAAVTKP